MTKATSCARSDHALETKQVQIAEPREGDATALALMITTSGELRLISGERGNDADVSLVSKWVTESEAGCVIRVGDEPIAMGTVSVRETNLPKGTIEVCHVIVNPLCRRHYRGSQLVLELADAARRLGYTRLVGRVVPENTPARRFLDSLRWEPIEPPDPGDTCACIWFESRIDK